MKKYLVVTLVCLSSLFWACEEPKEEEEPNKMYIIEVFELPFFDNLEYDEIVIIEFDKNGNRLCQNRIPLLAVGESEAFVAKKNANQLKIYFHCDLSNTFCFQEELLFKGTNEFELLGSEITGEEYFDAVLGQ